MIEVKPLDHAREAAPMLRQLRYAIDEDTFCTRLERAVAAGYKVLAAFDGSALRGALGYHLTDDICWGRTLFVDDLVVDSAARGQGIGAALLSEARAIAKESCDHIRLCSGFPRADAHRFYETHGFSRASIQFALAI